MTHEEVLSDCYNKKSLSCPFKLIDCQCGLTSTIYIKEMCEQCSCPFVFWLSGIVEHVHHHEGI